MNACIMKLQLNYRECKQSGECRVHSLTHSLTPSLPHSLTPSRFLSRKRKPRPISTVLFGIVQEIEMTTSSDEVAPPPVRRKVHTWVNHALCILLSLVFLTAAIAKTTAFRELEATLAASKLVPVLLTSQAGVLLVVTEYLVALLLLIPKTRQPALQAATVLCSVFIAYSTWRWMQGISVPCHCFGTLFKLEPWQSSSLNLGILTISANVRS